MQRWVVACLGLVMAGCASKATPAASGSGSSAPPSAAAATSPTSPPSSSPTGLKVGDRTQTPDGNFVTLHNYDPAVTAASSFEQPSPGVGLVAVDVEACAGPNPTGGTASVNPLFFTLRMTDNTTASPDLIGQRKPELATQDLGPSQCGRGWVTFDVPQGETPKYLVVAVAGNAPILWSLS